MNICLPLFPSYIFTRKPFGKPSGSVRDSFGIGFILKHLVSKTKTLATRTQNTLYQNSKHFVPEPKTLCTRTKNKGYQTPK